MSGNKKSASSVVTINWRPRCTFSSSNWELHDEIFSSGLSVLFSDWHLYPFIIYFFLLFAHIFYFHLKLLHILFCESWRSVPVWCVLLVFTCLCLCMCGFSLRTKALSAVSQDAGFIQESVTHLGLPWVWRICSVCWLSGVNPSNLLLWTDSDSGSGLEYNCHLCGGGVGFFFSAGAVISRPNYAYWQWKWMIYFKWVLRSHRPIRGLSCRAKTLMSVFVLSVDMLCLGWLHSICWDNWNSNMFASLDKIFNTKDHFQDWF